MWNCLEPLDGSESSPNTFLNTVRTCTQGKELHKLNDCPILQNQQH